MAYILHDRVRYKGELAQITGISSTLSPPTGVGHLKDGGLKITYTLVFLEGASRDSIRVDAEELSLQGGPTLPPEPETPLTYNVGDIVAHEYSPAQVLGLIDTMGNLYKIKCLGPRWPAELIVTGDTLSPYTDPVVLCHKDAEILLKPSTSGHDNVDSPKHYDIDVRCACGRTYEPYKIAQKLSWNRGNALKYIIRAGKKGDEIEDLRKAKKHLDFEINRLTAKPYCKSREEG